MIAYRIVKFGRTIELGGGGRKGRSPLPGPNFMFMQFLGKNVYVGSPVRGWCPPWEILDPQLKTNLKLNAIEIENVLVCKFVVSRYFVMVMDDLFASQCNGGNFLVWGVSIPYAFF